MKKSLFAIVVSIMLFSLSFATGAGEWKAVYGRAWADPETQLTGGAIFFWDEQGVGHRLTEDGIPAGNPTWTPDSRILFSARFPDREGTIHIINADGSNLTTLPYEGFGAVMSENYLAFETGAGVEVVNLRTNEITTFPLANIPAISPDETMIAFVNGDGVLGSGVIAVSDIERDTRREAARLAMSDRPWFYDNDRIVYTGYNEETGVQWVSIVDLRTGEITPLAPGGLPSVTGEWVIYSVYDVYAIKPDGSEHHIIPELPAGARILGNLSFPDDVVEEPRAVQPMGKLPTVWATLKK